MLNLKSKKFAVVFVALLGSIYFYSVAESGISKCTRDAKIVIKDLNDKLHGKLSNCRKKDTNDEIIKCIDDAILFLERDR